MTSLLPFAVICGAALLARRMDGHVRIRSVTAALESRWMPAVLGVASAFIIWWVWGSLTQVAVYHDEAAYVLQARIFASGRWVSAGRPLPEFFEQMAVLVTPVLAPKMPPGHAVVMVPGIWLGVPGLTSVVFGGIAGALLFALARRIANGWTGLLAWIIWITAPGVLRWWAAYFSEATTSALWLGSWWALLEWRETRKRRWLMVLAGCIGFGAITRPLTMFAFALPVAPVVISTVVRRRAWRDLSLALILGASVLCIIPLWSSRTTGQWRDTPLALYTRTYMPWDIPGFRTDSTRPERPLPPDLEQVHAFFTPVHTRHTVRALPSTLWRRLRFIAADMWSGWRGSLVVLALLGLVAISTQGAFALATAGIFVLAYLWYAHTSNWSVYYLELQPVLAFLTALGCWRLIERIAALPVKHRAATAPSLRAEAAPIAAALALCIALWPLARDVRAARQHVEQSTAYHRRFRSLTTELPESRSIVFVRYGPRHSWHFSLVRNVPDIDRERVLIAYDRGVDNTRLLQLLPGRVPYLYDDSSSTIVPLAPDGVLARPAASAAIHSGM